MPRTSAVCRSPITHFLFMKRLAYVLKALTHRHQEPAPFLVTLSYAVKVMVMIALLAAVGHFAELPLLLASFGPSCILVCLYPNTEYAQPINIVASYILCAAISLLMVRLLPPMWWNIALMLSVCVLFMTFLRITHAPAGAIPMIIFASNHQDIGLEFIFFPVATGACAIVSLALIMHRIPPRRQYPKRVGAGS